MKELALELAVQRMLWLLCEQNINIVNLLFHLLKVINRLLSSSCTKSTVSRKGEESCKKLFVKLKELFTVKNAV